MRSALLPVHVDISIIKTADNVTGSIDLEITPLAVKVHAKHQTHLHKFIPQMPQPNRTHAQLPTPKLHLPPSVFIPTMTISPASCPSEFVVLGSGVSTAIPRISCIIRRDGPDPCKVCYEAHINSQSKNRRCNVAALVRMSGRTVLIDCGKTIRESAMRHFPTLGVENVDAIVLTHGHADAVMGLDDARDIQMSGTCVKHNGIFSHIPPEPTPVFLNEDTMKVCRNVFPYLMPAEIRNPISSNHQRKDVPRRVAALSWQSYGDSAYFKPFYPVEGVGIQFVPFPMLHGGEYICMGFVITMAETPTSAQNVIAYLSDLHALPQSSMDYLRALPRIDLLVVDILSNSNVNPVHFSKADAIELVRELRPVEAVAIGMTCSIGFHDDVNAELAELESEGLKLRLAYDGERFPCRGR